MVLAQGVLLYVYRRPIFSHVYFFFLQSLMVYFLLRFGPGNYGEGKWSGLKLAGLGALLGLMILTRQARLIMALVWPLVLVVPCSLGRIKASWKKLAVVYLAALAVMLPFLLVFIALGSIPGMTSAKERLSDVFSLDIVLSRLFHIFFGIDWGLIYLQPFMVLGCICLFGLKWDLLKKALLWMSLPLLLNFYLVIQWGTQASYYGYRYLIFGIIPLAIYPLAKAMEFWYQKWGNKVFIALSVLAVIPAFAMLMFEGNARNLTLVSMDLGYGRVGWGNNTYVWEVLSMPFLNPLGFLIAVFKGGLFYYVFLIDQIFHFNFIPALTIKYDAFQWVTLVRTFILYAIPFVLLAIFWRFEKGYETPVVKSKKTASKSRRKF